MRCAAEPNCEALPKIISASALQPEDSDHLDAIPNPMLELFG